MSFVSKVLDILDLNFDLLVVRIQHLKTMNACTTFYANSSSRC